MVLVQIWDVGVDKGTYRLVTIPVRNDTIYFEGMTRKVHSVSEIAYPIEQDMTNKPTHSVVLVHPDLSK